VGVRIRNAILVLNILFSERNLEPDCHFAFLNIPQSEEQSEKLWLVTLQMFHKLQYIETQLCIPFKPSISIPAYQ
jgi:hypothetical protein